MIPLTNMMKYCARRCVSVGVGCWMLEVRKSGISDDIKVSGQGRSPSCVQPDDTGQNSVASKAYGWLGMQRQISLHQCRSCEMAFFFEW